MRHGRHRTTKPGQENLHQPFPGFSTDSPFGAELVFDYALVREIPERQLRRLARADKASAPKGAVEMYADAARSLAETGRCRVVICARPEELQDREEQPPSEESKAGREEDQDKHETGGDLHDLLKAAALTLPAPLQLMRKETLTGIASRTNGQRLRPLQDEATRAWNLHTALYYKADGTPWRMQRHSSDLATCYVGVSFYRSANGNELHTAVAQVFNERGDGVVVRGDTAHISKNDRQPPPLRFRKRKSRRPAPIPPGLRPPVDQDSDDTRAKVQPSPFVARIFAGSTDCIPRADEEPADSTGAEVRLHPRDRCPRCGLLW
ncbi:hypothetical protein RKD19_001177 [Streptomyces canus]